MFVALAALIAIMAIALGMVMRRARRSMIFAAAAVIAVFIGCHHGKVTSQATPVGATTLNIQAVALDANGNSLNTSRVIQGEQGVGFVLDVIAGN
jgi:hypothetical protein